MTDIVETLKHLQGNCTGDAAITFISPLTGHGSTSGGYTEYQSGRRCGYFNAVGGVLWKKQGGGKAVKVDKSDISALTWMKVPRTNQLCIRTKDGLKYKFISFRDQLLTRRRLVDKTRPMKEQSLMDWARPKLKDKKKWLLIIDPRLEEQYLIRPAQKACSLAYYCLSNNHKARPLMTDIVETLEHLQGNYIGDAAITFISPLTGHGNISVGYTEYQSGRWLDSQGQNTSVVHEAVVAQYMMMVAELVRKEIHVMKLLQGYPNVVVLCAHTILDMGRTKEALLVMEYCDKSLVSVLESRGAGFFEENQILLMFKDISTKAENLLLGSDGLWKLCDFGSTSTNHKRFERPKEMGIKEDTITNHTTPAYRSPEDLVLREVIREKFDIWALGCLLFRICHFKSAFEGESKLQVLNGNYRIPESPKYGPSITMTCCNLYQILDQTSRRQEICLIRHSSALQLIFYCITFNFTNVISLIKLRVAFHAINARRLPLAPLVYTLVKPPMTTSSANNSVFRGFFEKQKLTGPNFIDWYRQLRIVLSVEDKLNYLEHPIPVAPVPAQAGQQVAPEFLAAHAAWELKTLFAQQAEQELLQTMREFHSCKQEEGRSVNSYVLKMKSCIDNLERFGHPVLLGLGVSLILISLRKEFDGFMQNYNMHIMGKTINELHAMLKLHEQTLPKNNAPALHAIQAGHWKRNCPQYLAELLKNKKLSQGASGSGIFTIELYTFLNKSWVYDTGCGTHICNTTQGLRRSRKLKPGALSFYVGNGIISVSRLYDDGYVNCFVDNSIQVSRNNMVYFSAIPRDDIFEINLSGSYTNVSSMYALSNKRAKSNLDSALLWHCRLGHISKKRIEKLQHDGLLNSTDLGDFENCVPCMSGKMARKPYTHQVERVKDLLGLIHTDVCGPFKIVSRQGASYFVTFTDDFSRYGYVYLLKHKHEVFETFKVFQKEVENQLERRNRALLDMVRSMMSQTTLPKSFWDYALETVARILNMVPTKKVEKTPYEVWHGQAHKVSYLKVWGCESLVKRDTLTKPDKLKLRSIKCIFIGYPKETVTPISVQ
ncbi:zinc finger, CCHC-type containing protein [Tanacetum coccineum]